MGHTSPIYVACGGEWGMFNEETAQYMLTLMNGCIEHIRHTSRQHQGEGITHHHGLEDHGAYLEAPFVQAQEAIHRRMHQLGISH